MSSISSSPVPWQVAETVTDSASEHNSANDSGSITNFRDTLSGRWGMNRSSLLSLLIEC
ncbi:hypothetical protein L873DRAFT_351197 [Choiromyces venosus 120613-1]|uniref:Uncharacterized protein n=1 Tax=Choiromyces venosus 120613-1 TaxID=1336337 RepID=A0A3N4IYY6_9PEZI|nr:hypothetical protein L873DRAFT_351197 [Choiromyces venosus 120613-1]